MKHCYLGQVSNIISNNHVRRRERFRIMEIKKCFHVGDENI